MTRINFLLIARASGRARVAQDEICLSPCFIFLMFVCKLYRGFNSLSLTLLESKL